MICSPGCSHLNIMEHAANCRRGSRNGRNSIMSTIALRVVGISVAAALIGTTSAGAQLLVHKDISVVMATTIALTAIESCKASGYAVSVHCRGRNGETLVALA